MGFGKLLYMKKITPILLFVVGLAFCSLVFAIDEKPAAKSEHVMYNAADLKWADAPPALPAGAKIAVLEGDPGKADCSRFVSKCRPDTKPRLIPILRQNMSP